MSSIHSTPAPRFQGRKEAAPKQSVNPLKTAFMGFLALNPFAAAAASTSANDKFSRSQLATQVQHPSLPTVHADLFHKRNTPKQQAKMDALIDLIHQEDADHPFTRSLKQDADVEAASAAEVEAAIASLTDPEAQQILKKGPFPPKNVKILSPNFYPDAPPYTPVPTTNNNYSEIYTSLKNGFLKRFNGDQAKAKATADLLNDPQLTSLAPDLNLRAALVYLNGTIGEPALASYRRGDFKSVEFSTDVPDDANAQSVSIWGEDKPRVQFHVDLAGEDFKSLTPIVAHENLHSDSTEFNQSNISKDEETFANAFQALLYSILAVEDNEIALKEGIASRSNNMIALALAGSIDKDGNLDLNSPLGRAILPASENPSTSFAELVANGGTYSTVVSDVSKGNPTLDGVLTLMTGRSIKGAQFDQDALSLFKAQKIITPKERLKLLGPEVLNTNIPLNGIQKKNIPPTAAPSPQENTAPPPNPQEEPPTQIPLQTYTTPALEAVKPEPAPAPAYPSAAT